MPTSSLPADRRRPPEFHRCSGLLVLLPRHPQQSSGELDPRWATCLDKIVHDLPALYGDPITLEVLPELSVVSRKLLSEAGRGTAVFAGSFIRERKIVLETSLLLDPDLSRAILVHELFHFVWARLGSGARRAFTSVLEREREVRARGELGESSSVAKARANSEARAWKHYVCESFCDTAAYLLTGSTVGVCLKPGKRAIAARREWFSAAATNGWKL